MVSDARLAEFERMGVERLRLMIHGSVIPVDWTTDALEWVAAQDRREREESDFSQSSQSLTALSAKRAAWIAAIAAISAAIITIAGIIISVLAWLYPRVPRP